MGQVGGGISGFNRNEEASASPNRGNAAASNLEEFFDL
jgi:hypothetical protein